MHNLNSPNSSPTASDFPASHGGQHHSQHGHHHTHTPHSLSRQHSFQHVSNYRGESASSSTTLPSSPGGSISTMDLFDDGSCDPPPSGRGSTKRQRIDESGVSVGVNGIGSGDGSMSLMSAVSSPGSGTGGGGGGGVGLTVPKKSSSRARSDSAPLGYAGALWQQGGLGGGGAGGRPRSGSGMMSRGIPNIGNMTRGNNASTPLLSITTAESDLNGR